MSNRACGAACPSPGIGAPAKQPGVKTPGEREGAICTGTDGSSQTSVSPHPGPLPRGVSDPGNRAGRRQVVHPRDRCHKKRNPVGRRREMGAGMGASDRSEDLRSLFARSLGREMDDFDFSLLLTQPGSVRMDLAGNIPPSQVISLAEGLGVQDVVVGKVSYNEARNSGQVWLEASLRVIRIAQGKSEFELHKAQSMEDLSNQEGAAELARTIAPQLSTLLGGPQAGDAEGAGAPTPGPQTSPPQAETVGPLLVYVPSAQYPYWMELENILREQFKNMRRISLEMGAAESAVKLDGVSGDNILRMSGTRLPSGATVRIESYSTETQTMKVSFTPAEKVQAETR